MWWHNDRLLQRYTEDFLRDALQRTGVAPPGNAEIGQLLEQPSDFGFSSLHFINMASRFSRCLGMDRTGVSDLLLARRSLEGWMETAKRSLEIDSSRIGFFSSGSAGEPSFSEHDTWRLEREVNHFSALMPQASRVVSTVPSHHIYGFIWGILLPACSDRPVEHIDPATALPSSWGARLAQHDVLIATPDLWELLVSNSAPLPRHFTAISSTAPLPESVFLALQENYRDAVIREVYGSSETAGIAWREHGSACYQLLPYWKLMTGENDTQCLLDQDDPEAASLPLQDRLELVDNHQFRILGRKDAVIQIAGHNINLKEVRDQLVQHPDVCDADVRPSGEGAQRSLKLALQLKQQPDDLEQWCQDFNKWTQQTPRRIPPANAILLTHSLPRSKALNKPANWSADMHSSVTGRFFHAFE